MSAVNTYKWRGQRVLTGIFRSPMQAYQGQEVLTDFGYPKEASSKIELKTKSGKLKAIIRKIPSQINDKIWGGLSITAVLILGALLAGGHFYSTLNFSEIAILIIVWVLLLALSAVICTFIGMMVALLFSAELTENSLTAYKDEVENGGILLQVTVKTSTDAQDIAREWKQIGGKVV